MRVLIIEDDEATAAYIQKGLVEAGHTVDIAVQGDEVEWGPFLFRVLEAPAHGLLLAELRLRGRESTR